MDILTQLIGNVNDVILTYILIIMLLGCAFWFTYKTKFVQFRMIGEMVRLLGDSTGKTEGREHHISSFQAFAISIASRVGTGNLAGVATAITLGGPGAVFWMWVIALFGASSAFIESTLAQLYKVHGHNSFVGGPAYYMKKGLKQPWMGILFLFAHFHLRVCFQFRAEQHYLCRIRGSFQYFSGSDGMHIDCTYINYYFRRYSAYSQSQQHHCTHHGLGVYFFSTFHRDYECQTFAGSH